MKLTFYRQAGFTLVEMLVTTSLIGVLGVIVFSVLNVGTILGAKNTATNTAHQQARVALLQMTKNLHSSASPLTLFNPDPADPTSFSGISFELCAGDSLSPIRLSKIDSAVPGAMTVNVMLNGNPIPVLNASNRPHLIIPGYSFDSEIQSITGSNPAQLTLVTKLPDSLDVRSPSTSNVSCFITDVCSYEVKNGALTFFRPQGTAPGTVVASGVSQSYPFKTASNGLAVNVKLTTADISSDRYMASHKIKSVGNLLNATIPIKVRLTPVSP
ncbi:MAG: type II secretion system protein [Chthoniobacterales bacterium]